MFLRNSETSKTLIPTTASTYEGRAEAALT